MPQVSLEDFVKSVRGGYLASFPTDTVPALAVRPDRADLLFEVKQRSFDKPFILMAATIEELWFYTQGSVEERKIWQQTAERYLPGALTLVLPASQQVPSVMNPQNPTSIGVRVPDQPIARAILAQTGPLATTSANKSGQPALQTIAEIEAQFPQVLTLLPTELHRLSSQQFLAETPTPETPIPNTLTPEAPIPKTVGSGTPSTVARWTPTGWEILRQGSVVIDT